MPNKRKETRHCGHEPIFQADKSDVGIKEMSYIGS